MNIQKHSNTIYDVISDSNTTIVCDARPTVTFPDCAGTKFILLGDS